jgi:hypothetical protein
LIALPTIDVIIVSLFMQDNESIPEQTSRVTAVNSSNWHRKAIAIGIIALAAGTSGYLLGIRTNQNASQSTQRVSFQPSPTIPAQSSISTSSPISTQAITTPAFKTYRNVRVGFEMKYPGYADAEQLRGVQGWAFSDDWNFVIFSKLNQDLYILVVFPLSGTLDTLQTVRNKIPTIANYAELDHPIIPLAFSDITKTLVKTFTIDGYPARWYKDESVRSTNPTTVNEIHFIARNHGFIFRNANPYFNEEEMNTIVSSFTFTK